MGLLYSLDSYNQYTIGTKAIHLMELAKDGYRVPDFVVIPHEVIKQFLVEDEFAEKMVSEIKKKIPTESYAVRSAAIGEDLKCGAMAGQFMTRVDVPKEELRKVINEVVEDFKLKSSDSAFSFSVIVQIFIEPDTAGVLFTRDPLGERNAVIEYRTGRGSNVVGGADVNRIQLLPDEISRYKNKLPFIDELLKVGKIIEDKYEWPQDIEWVSKDNVLYLLQTRPVTTISDSQWKGIKYLEHELSKQVEYIYIQTTISETFNKPRTLAFDILNKMYGVGGPIEETYTRLGIIYHADNQFVLFGNDLYIDRQSEIKTIFPSYGYLKHKSLAPQREQWSGFFQTLNNQLALARLSIEGVDLLQKQVVDLLTVSMNKGGLADRLEFFFKNYSLVFEINLRTETALQRLLTLTDKKIVNELEPISSFNSSDEGEKLLQSAGLFVGTPIGNSISVDDFSPFVSHISENTNTSIRDDVWKNIPTFKRQMVKNIATTTAKYLFTREMGRLAGIRLMNNVREVINELGKTISPDDPALIHYASLSEIQMGEVLISDFKKRKDIYETNNQLRFPRLIASFTQMDYKEDSQGVAPGQAEGVVVTVEKVMSSKEKKILLTDMLTPDLTKYFSNIVGIIAKQGGLLSHLAIMAREAGIPVVVTSKLVSVGTMVFLDGTKGEIRVIDGIDNSLNNNNRIK